MSMDRHSRPSQVEQDSAGDRSEALLRGLLQRDYTTPAGWDAALRDFARMSRQALAATETFVALHEARTGHWSACTSDGTLVEDASISLYGSRSVLERVRRTLRPILATVEAPLLLDSASLQEHAVQSVLAVPLFFWDTRRQPAERVFGGCLYAHRSRPAPAFTNADAELVLDLTELASRTLNLVRQVHRPADRPAAPARRGSSAAGTGPRLGELHSREPQFVQHVLEPLRRVAYASRVNLLLLGPSGSGKSFLAQAYHRECPRRDAPFVVLDCSQVLSSETLGPELFGYAPDSGYANAPRRGLAGKAELAAGGTLFIDEIGLLPLELQNKLLRLLQSGAFTPLGGSLEKRVDLQIVAATNENLAELVRTGRFREDLFHRLRELTVELPPLSRRRADIADLAAGMLHHARERFGRPDVQTLGAAALHVLEQHDWSLDGNLRGLEHTIHRSVLLAPPGTAQLDAEHVAFDLAMPGPAAAHTSPGQASAAGGEFEAEPRTPAPAAAPDPRRALLERKIHEHRAKLSALAADPDISDAFGDERRPMAISTLRVRLQRFGLDALVEAVRRGRHAELDLAAIREALQRHGSGSAAAAALGISREALVWQIRKAGLTIRELLTDPQ